MLLIIGIRDAFVFKDLKPYGDIKRRLGATNAVLMEVPEDTNLETIHNINGVTSVTKAKPQS